MVYKVSELTTLIEEIIRLHKTSDMNLLTFPVRY